MTRAVLTLFGASLVIGLLALFPALSARTFLLDAREHTRSGRVALQRGDARTAAEGFEQARASFIQARDQVGNPFLRFVSYLPVIGRSADATRALVDAGLFTADAGTALAGALDRLQPGAAALDPREGRIPLAPFRALAPGLRRAQGLLDEASSIMSDAPDSWLVGPVEDAVNEFVPLLEDARNGVTAAAALSETLPEFLGARGTRRYFVGAQTPAELRGTGGLMGSYSILTVRNGRLRFASFRPLTDLRDLRAGGVRPPNPDFAARYDRFRGRASWTSVNLTPDFPSAAVAIERLYLATEGVRLDGVIAADPFAFAAFLEVVGSVEVPGTEHVLTDENVVKYITHDAYSDFPPRERKEVLGQVAGVVIGRFLGTRATTRDAPREQTEGRERERSAAEDDRSAEEPPVREPARGKGVPVVPAARALVEAASRGHLLFHAIDREVQAAFRIAGVTGALGVRGADLFAAVANNAAGNKADFFLEQEIQYDIGLEADGSASGTATVELTNDAPTGGEPAYVIGPYPTTDLRPGENRTYLSIFCGSSCLLEGFRRDGRPAAVGSQVELGYHVYSTFVRLPSERTGVLEFRWDTADAWEGDGGSGSYRLVVSGQPMLNPTRLSVHVRPPEGMRFTSLSPGMSPEGDGAVWEGKLTDRLVLDLTFAAPLPVRMWRSVVDFLGQPVVRLAGPVEAAEGPSGPVGWLTWSLSPSTLCVARSKGRF